MTIALIINEQNHLEQTLMKQPTIHKEVLGKLEFALQDVLSMNQILFPYFENEMKITFAGKTIHQFEQVDSRISIGKDLYSFLFNSGSLKNVEHWAYLTPHTGSRKDYWPHLFNNVDEEVPGKIYKVRLKKCNLIPGSPHFYSPSLLNVWKNISHQVPQPAEWYKDSTIVDDMLPSNNHYIQNIEADYCHTLEKLEIACMANNIMPLF